MITDPYLSDVVAESGRREITIGMVVEAERRYWKALTSYSNQEHTGLAERYQQGMIAAQQAASPLIATQQSQGQGYGQGFGGYGTLGNILGGAFGFSSRCPCCGR